MINQLQEKYLTEARLYVILEPCLMCAGALYWNKIGHMIRWWIIPGLLLQLLINPQMEAASKVFFKLLHSSFQVGPIRVWRWIRALFYPLLVLLFDLAESFIWIPLVAFANRPNPKTAAPKEKVWENRRRSSINPKRVSIYLSAHAASVQDSTIQRMSYRPSYMGTISPRKSFVKFAK